MQRKIEDIFYSQGDNLLIDVRSPHEFTEGTIPSAINIPIFDDEERIEIGKLYKKESIEVAKYRGLEIASKKLPDMYKRILGFTEKYKDIIIFCARGGLRSTSLVEVMRILGIRVYQLMGGYKAFRRFTLDYIEKIEEKHRFLVLHGFTGVGKTRLMSILEDQKVPVLNMALLAQNTGSVFGEIMFPDARVTQKMFEASLVWELAKSRKKLIVVESEGKRIGSINIPNSLYKTIGKGRHILISTNLENRVNRLMAEYVKNPDTKDEVLIKAIENLKKVIGKEGVDKYIAYIYGKQYGQVAKELIVNYYDRQYKTAISKYNYDLHINYDTIEIAAKEIQNYYVQLEGKIDQ